MKSGTLKHALATTSLVLAAGYAGSAAAHSVTQSNLAGYAAGTTDVYTISCPDAATQSVSIRVDYRSPTVAGGGTGSVIWTAVGASDLASVIDSTPRTALGTADPSAYAYLNGGSGNYIATLRKTDADPGGSTAVIEAHCMNIPNCDLNGPGCTVGGNELTTGMTLSIQK